MSAEIKEAGRCQHGRRRAGGRLSLTGGGVELDIRRLLNDGTAPDSKAVTQQLERQAVNKNGGGQFKWERE